jgi:sugar O-acyltransferase (sialic acid O-acetyltransferase NeuD family)
VVDVIEQEREFEIAGIVEQVGGPTIPILGYPVFGTDDELVHLRKNYEYGLVTVGQIKSPELRMRLYSKLQEFIFTLPIIISPRAYVSPNAKLGAGTIVMHDALVNAGANIGVNCILNSKALIEHDAVVKDHCHISTGSVVNGGVVVGRGTFVGSGSVLRDGIHVGQDSFIAAGTKVTHDLPPNSNYRNRL